MLGPQPGNQLPLSFFLLVVANASLLRANGTPAFMSKVALSLLGDAALVPTRGGGLTPQSGASRVSKVITTATASGRRGDGGRG